MTALGLLTYSPNNSGGSWWLSHEDYEKLEKAGWTVHWMHSVEQDHGDFDGKGTEKDSHTWSDGFSVHSHHYGPEELPSRHDGSDWLGTTAYGAVKRFASAAEGVAEWERITGQSASSEGCNCCGEPHSFTFVAPGGARQYSSVEVVSTSLTWG